MTPTRQIPRFSRAREPEIQYLVGRVPDRYAQPARVFPLSAKPASLASNK
jgi:hypothetical protein